MLPSTLQFFIMMIACSINERMQKALNYKSEEVLVLKEVLREVTKKKRIDFTEKQRARLALLGKALTAKERREYCEVVKPKTILDWFRRIYSAKYDSSKSQRRKGRPPKPNEVRELVIQLAQENLSWGYTKIRDVVNKGLQIDICRNTVANILYRAGIVPAPEREKKRTWRQFIRSHWHCLCACDVGIARKVIHLSAEAGATILSYQKTFPRPKPSRPAYLEGFGRGRVALRVDHSWPLKWLRS